MPNFFSCYFVAVKNKQMKYRFLILALMIGLSFGMIACDDDDDSNVKFATIDDVVGTYLGDMECEVLVMGRTVYVDYKDVVADMIANNGDSTVTMTIYDFSYQGVNYGNIIVKKVAIESLSATEITLSGAGITALTKDNVSYDSSVSVIGDFDKSKNEIELDVDMSLPVNPKMTIVFGIKFDGKKQIK